jgi:hypothetical protein
MSDVDALFLGHGDDQLAGVVGDGLRFGVGELHIHPGLQHGRGDHEDDEQYQHHVHQGGDVDVCQGPGFAPGARTHCHG